MSLKEVFLETIVVFDGGKEKLSSPDDPVLPPGLEMMSIRMSAAGSQFAEKTIGAPEG